MKLSYIIPVYNVEKYLRQCVDSILAQTFDDYEIILIDDGSPDNCPAICDEYKEKYPDIVKVVHKENDGPSAARNIGIDMAKGEYLFFMDADDYLVGDSIETVYSNARKVNADVVHNSFFSVNDGSETVEINKSAFVRDTAYSHEEIEKEIGEMVSSDIQYMWRNLFRTEFIRKNGIRLDEELKRVEDPPFNLWAFCAAETVLIIDVPGYCYRIRGGSLQRQKYVPDYDLWLSRQWKLKLTYYEKLCQPDKSFYYELARFTVIAMLPMLLKNIYSNRIRERRAILRRIGNSEMMRRSFKDYDISRFKSKSLDWWMTWCVKYKLYPLAHLICEKVLYKGA